MHFWLTGVRGPIVFLFCMCIWYVFLCVCACICGCVCMSVIHVKCNGGQRLMSNVFFCSFPPYLLEARSLMEPEPSDSTLPSCLGESCLYLPSTGMTDGLLFMWVLWIQISVLTLARQVLYPLSHRLNSGPWFFIIFLCHWMTHFLFFFYFKLIVDFFICFLVASFYCNTLAYLTWLYSIL